MLPEMKSPVKLSRPHSIRAGVQVPPVLPFDTVVSVFAVIARTCALIFPAVRAELVIAMKYQVFAEAVNSGISKSVAAPTNSDRFADPDEVDET